MTKASEQPITLTTQPTLFRLKAGLHTHRHMKTTLLTFAAALWLGVSSAFAHGDVELGPNGGRIVEFSTNETLHGEVTLKDGKFHVAVLDKDMKPVELKDQTLLVTGGDRAHPERPKVEKTGNHFVFPALKGDSYLLVLQFKDKPSSKFVTARFEYDATICSACKNPEWLCKCGEKAGAKKEDRHEHKPGEKHDHDKKP
jgi:hypothetical protein